MNKLITLRVHHWEEVVDFYAKLIPFFDDYDGDNIHTADPDLLITTTTQIMQERNLELVSKVSRLAYRFLHRDYIGEDPFDTNSGFLNYSQRVILGMVRLTMLPGSYPIALTNYYDSIFCAACSLLNHCLDEKIKEEETLDLKGLFKSSQIRQYRHGEDGYANYVVLPSWVAKNRIHLEDLYYYAYSKYGPRYTLETFRFNY